jgi:molybdopterin-guanine dinucleotide biosynthesis protein A
MGVDKATMLSGGEPLAVRTARVLAAVCDPVIEVGPGVSGLRAVREDPPGGGPLAAFLAGVDALATAEPIMLVACDLPFLEEAVLRLVADHPGRGSAVPVVDGHKQYACARWSQAAIAAARIAFGDGDGAMRTLLAAGDFTLLPSDEHGRALADVDDDDDLRRLGLT